MVSSRNYNVLIVDDDKGCCWLLAEIAKKEGYKVQVAHDGYAALEIIQKAQIDLMLMDIRMPGLDGIEALRRIHKINASLPVIMITAYHDDDLEQYVLDQGAKDLFCKPFDNEEVRRTLRRTLGVWSDAEDDLDKMLRDLMGPSDAVGRLISQVACVGKSDLSVVVTGETGSGKELIAQAVHRVSPRARGPFVAVDCGAIPDTLFESEIFGFEKGAFTGAVGRKDGKMVLAHEGTLLLDEISNLSFFAQAKLLRVLQDKMVTPLGSRKSEDVDVRIVASCNEALQSMVQGKKFRSDLFFRLNEFIIEVPPLRERKADIPFLAKRFLSEMGQATEGCCNEFSDEAMDKLVTYHWPGNVRQLRAVVRGTAITGKGVIGAEHLNLSSDLEIGEPADATPSGRVQWDGQPFKEIVERNVAIVESDLIRQALIRAKGNKAEAARLLQIDYKTLYNKMRRLQI